MKPFTLLVGLVCVTSSNASSPAQSTLDEASFEVVSIKRSLNERPPNAVDFTFFKAAAKGAARGRFRLPGTPVSTLIELAYGIDDALPIDAPAWVRAERYDIDARTRYPHRTGMAQLTCSVGCRTIHVAGLIERIPC